MTRSLCDRSALHAVALLLATLCVSSIVRGAQSGIVPVPELDRWRTQMISAGEALCAYLAGPRTDDELLSHVYYDAQRVFLQIGDYTGDGKWNVCAQRAESIYRDKYVLPNKGSVPGYWNFTHGLAMDYLRTRDPASREAVILLSENAAFAREGTPLAWTVSADSSREVAYAIMSYLNAERVGAPRRARLVQLIDQALGHIQEWFVEKSATRIAPFMVGLTAEALIDYFEATRDPRIPPAIKLALDGSWTDAWVASASAFWYDNRDRSLAPDLNLLIAPAYAWLYRQTGDRLYRDRGDQVFAGGVKGAYLGHGKQFNQNYRWSFDYVRWRELRPPNVERQHRVGPTPVGQVR